MNLYQLASLLVAFVPEKFVFENKKIKFYFAFNLCLSQWIWNAITRHDIMTFLTL